MILFSTQRFFQISRSITALFCGLALSSLLGISAHGQSQDELFRGTWQIDTPDQGVLIIMLKSQGRASYFWGDNTDRTVYPGTWTSNEETATLTWADQSQHRIKRDNLGFGITFINSNGTERYAAAAQQVPSEILGQWAKPPVKENQAVSALDKAKGFFGVWKIGEDDATAEYVFVEPDRSAASTAGSNNGLRGSWAKQGSELHIAWDTGSYSILRENKREFAYKQISPGVIIEDDETDMRPAVRTIDEKVPSGWLANYQKEREMFTGGVVFSSRKVARDFYRGDWIVKLSEKSFERIEIARFGGLTTSTDGSLRGDWRMQGQDIFMRWDDGMRKILSPIGRGFVLYEYKPGRPLDGVPTRLNPAAPEDNAKLAKHLKGREDVEQQMRSITEAAGLDPSKKKAAGWGRTFARWVWPFGEDEPASNPSFILEQEFEESASKDPWWWPFWSEKPTPEVEAVIETSDEAEVTTEPLPITGATETIEDTANLLLEPSSEAAQIPEILEEPVTEETPKESKKKRKSAGNWIWPF